MHLVRFLIAVVLIELVVLVGVALERQQLVLRDRLSTQEERIQQAQQQRAKHLLRIGQLSSAPRIIKQTETTPAAGANPP